jgi:thiamine pyrophosphokinase
VTTIIVVAGGPPPDADVAALLPDADAVIAADSGLDNARALGLRPTLVVGDLDSISEAGLRWATTNAIPVDSHPSDKDATDLDLALTTAVRSANDIVVVDSGAGRVDHALANALLLGADRFSPARITAFVGRSRLTVIWSTRSLNGCVGDTVSLIAPVGRATGISTSGLRWPLSGATLEAGSTRGVSNVFEKPVADISVESGVVFAIQPFGSG